LPVRQAIIVLEILNPAKIVRPTMTRYAVVMERLIQMLALRMQRGSRSG
jgi:hypothetical protein